MTEPHREPFLRGVRVLDLTQNLPGPYASFLLASWGADVIKVEPPKGDPARFMRPFFDFVNRGKRSIVLDLRNEDDRASLAALIAESDVLLEGFRPGVVQRLGCDWERARAINPRLVYCSISAHGQEGPRRDEPGHDLNLQALAGVCHLERDARGVPRGTMLPIADLSSSLLAVAGICAALRAREADGRGRYLDVAMADGVLSWAHVWGQGIDLAGNARKALKKAGPLGTIGAPLVRMLDRLKLYAMPHYGVYRARDGRWLSLGIVDEDHFWKSLCEAMGLPERLAALKLPARIAGGLMLRPLLAARMLARERDDWLERFRRAGVPATAIVTPGETNDDPQFQQRGMFDARGMARAPLPDAIHIAGDAPGLGEHTAQILAELGR